jgi:hypothetical protein
MENPERARWFAFSDQGRWRSADDGRFKIILDGLSLEYSLFDLQEDPEELGDIFDQEPPIARDLTDQLETWLRLTHGGSDLESALELAKKKHEELRALGYLE